MNGIVKKTGELAELYNKHALKVLDCLKEFDKALNLYLEEGTSDEFKEFAQNVDTLESEADDLRREIVHLLIEKRFLVPNTRRDFMNLLKFTDKAADYAEGTLDFIILKSMDITDEGKTKIKKIIELTIEQYNLLVEAIEYVFKDIHQAFSYVEKIADLESDVDLIETELINMLAEREDLSFALKILYRDFLTRLTDISDIIEDAADEIELIVALRRV
ncbi:MAG: DUF47 domain-containing protein [Halarsenatibacteraceae bacterium]